MTYLIVTLALALAVASHAQIFGRIERDGTNVWVHWSNCPPCFVAECSTNGTAWKPYLRYENYFDTNSFESFSWRLPMRMQQTEFWRLRPCE